MGKRKARLTSAQIQDVKRYCKENGYNLRKGLSKLGISLRLYYLSVHEKSEHNLPSDPNALQLTLNLFNNEETAKAEENLKKIEEEEKHKVSTAAMWAMTNGLGPEVVFIYELGKKNKAIAKMLLESINAAIQTDASQLYEQFEGNSTKIMLGCWVHCRRYFIDALAEDEANASIAIAAINKLYTIEHDADIAKLTIEQRCKKRKEEAYPVICDLEKWLYTLANVYPNKSPMSKAVNYALTHMPRLARYVQDGRYTCWSRAWMLLLLFSLLLSP